MIVLMIRSESNEKGSIVMTRNNLRSFPYTGKKPVVPGRMKASDPASFPYLKTERPLMPPVLKLQSPPMPPMLPRPKFGKFLLPLMFSFPRAGRQSVNTIPHSPKTARAPSLRHSK